MKILFFVSSMNAGGAERVAASLSNAWVQRGYEVCLVPTHLGSETSFYELDSRVRFQPLKKMLGWFPPFITPVRKWRAMRKIHNDFAPDVVLSFLTNVNVNTLIALKNSRTPILVCERTNPVASQSADARLRRLRSTLYPKATRVVVQTEDAARAFTAQEPTLSDVAVIPNPIPTTLFEAPTASVVERNNSCRLIAMGRLVPSKQFDQLLHVFASLSKEHPEWSLFIYGEGPERKALEEQALLLGCAEKVFLPGRTDKPWQVLAQAQLFVLTSAYEGFPNVLLEAMALGLPAVTVDCPSGPKTLSNNGHDAILVDLGDSKALQAALSELMGDARSRGLLGQRAKQSVRERYGIESVLDEWDKVFEQASVINKGKQGTQ